MRAILYTWPKCSFCRRAKELLAQHGVEYREVSLEGRKDERDRLYTVFGQRTMPLVLLDGRRIAGLEALERALAPAEPSE